MFRLFGGSRLALVALLVLFAMIGGVSAAAAQSSDDPGSAADNSAQDPDAETPTPPKRRCPRGLADVTPDAEEPQCEPPRCTGGDVDLAPEEEEPNCIDPVRLQGLQADFEQSSAAELSARDALNTALDELDGLRDELEKFQSRLANERLRLARAKADQRFAEIRSEAAEQSFADVSDALAEEEALIRGQIVEAYMGGDTPQGVAEASIGTETYTKLETAREYAAVVLDNQAETIDRVEALRAAVEALGALVAEVEADATLREADVAAAEAKVAAVVTLQETLVTDAQTKAKTLAEEMATVQARKKSVSEQLRITGAGGGSVGETLRLAQADQTAPKDEDITYAMPLEDTDLGSGFGPRVHPIFRDPRFHTGIDLSGKSGDEILAVADGVVVQAEEVSGYGNVVVVDHGNTIATLYAHMTADAVTVGDEVNEGDVLGYVGSTGVSTGPHLHFEVRLLGQPVDPVPYLT